MLRFLVSRPIAVLLTTIGLVVLGLVVLKMLPISLLPEVPIPQITVQVSSPSTSARELENTVTRPLRQQLMQVGQLKDIHSSTRSGTATISLEFEHGVNTDLAFIEVNEKIDQAVGGLPPGLERPRALKANVTDIPVFHLSIFAKEQPSTISRLPSAVPRPPSLELAELARNTLRRRIEQLPGVAFVDMSGFAVPEIAISPKKEIFQSLGLAEGDLENILQANDLNLGSILVQDDHYQYHIRFRSGLRTVADVEGVWFRHGGQVLRLKDVADVSLRQQERRGLFLHDGKEAIVFSVRKKAQVQLFAMKESFAELLEELRKDFPQLGFAVSNDQSELLEVSIDNLRTSLLWGAFFAFAVLFLFFREWGSPLLIGIVVPVSLIMALFGFYLTGTSINIISISGLLLGVGLMIDNGIIVMENIRQYREMGENKTEACVKGAEEVVRPLLSSALTTCSVFVPLVFLSGVGGALFKDQALSVSLALGASLLVAYFLVPTLLNLGKRERLPTKSISREGGTHKSGFYEKTADMALSNRWAALALFLTVIAAIWFILPFLKKETFPTLTRQGIAVSIDWDEPLSLEENRRRLGNLLSQLGGVAVSSDIFIGEQQFLLSQNAQGLNEATLWLFGDQARLEEQVLLFFQKKHPLAKLGTSPLKTVFDEVFASGRPPLTAHLQSVSKQGEIARADVLPILEMLDKQGVNAAMPPRQEQVEVSVLKERALRHGVPYDAVYGKLQSLFNQHRVGTLRGSGSHIPIVAGTRGEGLHALMEGAMVLNGQGQYLPLKAFVKTSRSRSPKTITAGKTGESLDLHLPFFTEQLVADIRQAVRQSGKLSVHFSGQAFEDQKVVRELAAILAISVLLLYLILAAQFESLAQPLIVILTVPIGASGALLTLWLAGQSLNLVSIIGLIVMGGIVVNDAILKVDMMNRLSGKMPLRKAVHIAGRRRLKPIVMTSATTILALLPVLFSGGLGAELQRPLAWAVVGGLAFGTLASLYFVPVLYVFIKKKK